MDKNNAYGGFIISNNVLQGHPIRYTYREKSQIPQLNGWHVLSPEDDDEYIRDPKNFTIVSAETAFKISPLLLVLYDAPYGTDLFWLYEDSVPVGFYDLKRERETNIQEILGVSREKEEQS